MNSEELKLRTRKYAVRAINLVNALPKSADGRVIGNQFIRCATSVGANYHAACRARTKAEFAAKSGIVLEEVDECLFWLQLIVDAEMLTKSRVNPLLIETQELTAIFTSTVKTANNNPTRNRN